MTPRTFHRGAVVSQRISLASYYWTDPLTDVFGHHRWRVIDLSQECTGAQLTKFSKPFRQRRKGPIVRFGGRKP